MTNGTQKTVEIMLGGTTKTVLIQTVGNGKWTTNEPILVKYRTGSKNHLVNRSYVAERNGKWVLTMQLFRNTHVTPVQWANQSKGSGWNLHNTLATSKSSV